MKVKFKIHGKTWRAEGNMSSGRFQFEKYASGSEQYPTDPLLAKKRDEISQVTQTIIAGQRRLSIQKRKLSDATVHASVFEKSTASTENPKEISAVIAAPCENAAETARTITIDTTRYKVKIFFKDNKWNAEVTLKGAAKNSTVEGQKAAIEAEMKKAIEEKLNELGGLLNRRSKAVTAQLKEDGGEFWVKAMNGMEWLHTIGNLGSSVWETVALPKGYWNREEGYRESTVHAPPTLVGLSDGVVEEVTEYQQLVKSGYDVATKQAVRAALWNSVKNISPESIKNAAVNFYEEKKRNYMSDKSYIVRHTVAKDAVAAVSFFIGGKGLKTVAKDVSEGVEKTGKEIFQKVDDDLIEGMRGVDGLSKRKIKESIDKGEISREAVEESKDEISDIAGKKGRKHSWEEVKALFKRGDNFNRKAGKDYPFNEITLK